LSKDLRFVVHVIKTMELQYVNMCVDIFLV